MRHAEVWIKTAEAAAVRGGKGDVRYEVRQCTFITKLFFGNYSAPSFFYTNLLCPVHFDYQDRETPQTQDDFFGPSGTLTAQKNRPNIISRKIYTNPINAQMITAYWKDVFSGEYIDDFFVA